MKHIDLTWHTVPRETFQHIDDQIASERDRLSLYLDQLLWWNRKINLVSRNATPELVWQHIRHSLLITLADPFIGAPSIIDAGTGGGLPGLPLAICFPEKQFLLNDIVTKKVLAVKQMVRKLSLDNVRTAGGSVADLAVEKPSLIISKHAFKIDDLISHLGRIPWNELVFYKGIDFMEELKGIEIPLSVEVFELSDRSGHSFYEGKVLLTVKRRGA